MLTVVIPASMEASIHSIFRLRELLRKLNFRDLLPGSNVTEMLLSGPSSTPQSTHLTIRSPSVYLYIYNLINKSITLCTTL
jgi:hypothetical protein